MTVVGNRVVVVPMWFESTRDSCTGGSDVNGDDDGETVSCFMNGDVVVI